MNLGNWQVQCIFSFISSINEEVDRSLLFCDLLISLPSCVLRLVSDTQVGYSYPPGSHGLQALFRTRFAFVMVFESFVHLMATHSTRVCTYFLSLTTTGAVLIHCYASILSLPVSFWISLPIYYRMRDSIVEFWILSSVSQFVHHKPECGEVFF